MAPPTINIRPFTHRKQECIGLYFDYKREIIDKVKTIEGVRWSATNKCWYMPFKDDCRQVIESAIGDACNLEFNIPPETPIKDEINGNSGSSRLVNGRDADILEVIIDEKQLTFYIHLPYRFKDEFKKLEGAWWHPGAKVWSALDTPENRNHLSDILKNTPYTIQYQVAPDKPRKAVKKPALINPVEPEAAFLRQMKLEDKSSNTINQYSWYVTWFLTINRNKEIKKDAGELVTHFLYTEIVQKGYSPSAQNQALSALKKYYSSVHHLNLDTENIPRPKIKRQLPKVISEEEFIGMYQHCKNKKHRIILQLLYGCGFRRSEVCDLRVDEVDLKRGLIFLKGKGGGYRGTNPGKKLLVDLEKYIKSYLPKTYLIEGQVGKSLSGSSIHKIVKRAAEKAGLKRDVYPHMLRHTFATHHMEKGTELRMIQEAMGHKSSKTTEIYTHVSRKNLKNMRNLLDDLDI